MSCKYTKAWIGKCNEKCEGDYCHQHTNKKCFVCGSQATHECDNTQGLVCGSPLCDSLVCDTIHEIISHGWNLKKFMDWTGREHTDSEVTYINEFVEKKEVEYQKILEKIKTNQI